MRVTKIAMVVKNFELQGISRVVANYCECLDKKKYQIIVIAGEPINDYLKAWCEAFGVKVYKLPKKKKEPIQFYYSLYKYLKSEKVDIVHVHGSSATIAFELLIAAFLGIKHRIAHSHSTSSTNVKIHKILKPLLNMVCTEALACSQNAGEWLFGKHAFTILYNGVDLSQFEFDPIKRDDLRGMLGIKKSDCVIGHIGRINRGKNQEFLIGIFDEFLKIRPDSWLLMVGTGPDEQRIKDIVVADDNREKIIMYGETDKVSDLYSAMDVFVFPSKHEGLPVTLIEAQASGLPCVVSDVVTDEVLVCDDVRKLSLETPENQWAEVVGSTVANSSSIKRKSNKDLLDIFDNNKITAHLEIIYDQSMEM